MPTSSTIKPSTSDGGVCRRLVNRALGNLHGWTNATTRSTRARKPRSRQLLRIPGETHAPILTGAVHQSHHREARWANVSIGLLGL